jgi:hypothetical protein
MALYTTPPDISSLREETTSEFLDRRERELVAQIAAIRGQLAPKEAELSAIQRMKAVINLADDLSPSLGALARAPSWAANPNQQSAPYAAMTIKQLTIQALLDHFPLGGSAAEIRDFIRDAYRRTIEPSSMRAQMHRLKADSILKHDPEKDVWDFAMGKRALYDTYSHQSSRNAMPELRDSDQDDDALLRAAAAMAWRDEPEKK